MLIKSNIKNMKTILLQHNIGVEHYAISNVPLCFIYKIYGCEVNRPYHYSLLSYQYMCYRQVWAKYNKAFYTSPKNDRQRMI